MAGKPGILILNKKDLADDDATKEWLGRLGDALALNAMDGQGVNALLKRLERIAADKAALGTGKAKLPLRLMIVGVPNSGKSSLINRLTGRRAAQVGDRPGVTRGKQWLTLENGMQLLDTPGILWPKFEDRQVGLHLAFCGAIKDEIMDMPELGLELIRVLLHDFSGLLEERYGMEGGFLEEDKDEALAAMEDIARRRGFVLQGGRIDYERTARTVIDEFRSGKIGRITLEYPS
jgi:ribosome biogenesis GTPase A